MEDHSVLASTGHRMLTGHECLLKGCLESDRVVDLVLGTRDSVYETLFDGANERAVVRALREHGISVEARSSELTVARSAFEASGRGQSVVALVAGSAIGDLAMQFDEYRASQITHPAPLLFVIEDYPGAVAIDPCDVLRAMGLPILAPSDLDEVIAAIEKGLAISDASGTGAACLIHHELLFSAGTLRCFANRIVEPVERGASAMRRKRTRISESDDVLRAARRLELSVAHNLPNPGETVPLGLITIGPCRLALEQALFEARLLGRIPILSLGMVNPLDTALVTRFLDRCRAVEVLEHRVGSVRPFLNQIENLRPQQSLASIVSESDVGATHVLDPTHPTSIASWLRRDLPEMKPIAVVHDASRPEVSQAPVSRSTLGDDPALHRVLQVIEERARAVRPGDQSDGSLHQLPVEYWPSRSFARGGMWAVRDATRHRGERAFVVCDFPHLEGPDLRRIATSAVDPAEMDRVEVASISIGESDQVAASIDNARKPGQITVLILTEKEDRSERGRVRHSEYLKTVDRLGFEPLQHSVRSLDDACVIRRARTQSGLAEPSQQMMRDFSDTVTVDRLPSRARKQIRVRLRPHSEIVDVVRTHPPVLRGVFASSGRVPPPAVRHGEHSVWRAHVQGVRGRGIGITARILCAAGREMGYHVQCRYEPESHCAQVLFTRSREDETPLPLTPRIPAGQADLIVSCNSAGALGALRAGISGGIGDPMRTAAAIDVASDAGREDSDPDSARQIAALRDRTLAGSSLIADVSRVCRVALGTNRLVDIVLLGIAYQMGNIPLTREAVDRAVNRVASHGFGRLREAFEFGRRLAHEPRLLDRTRRQDVEPTSRLLRRYVLSLRHKRTRGERWSRTYEELVRSALDEMPGLQETDSGREATRDFVISLFRCLLWGGPTYAKQYRRLIVDLYQSDRGDRGRAITRHAILALGDAMLIRDHLYLARLATSIEQRNWMRSRLGVRPSRGDEVTRRFLNRLELVGFGYRARLDFFSSDWTAFAVRACLGWLPDRWRGSQSDRDRREIITNAVLKARQAITSEYDLWERRFRALHELALENRLHLMTPATLRRIVGDQVLGGPPAHALDEAEASDDDQLQHPELAEPSLRRQA